MRIASRLLVLILFVVLVGATFGCSGGADETATERPSGDAGAEQMETAPARDGVGTSEGDVPPPFTLPDLDGVDVSLSDFEGKVVVLDLWATWCGPCRVEIPYLVELYEEFKNDGVVVVGIGLDQQGAEILRPFVEDNNVTYTILVGGRAISQAYNVTGIPTTFIIGRDGRIAKKHVGFAPQMLGELRADIEAQLAPGPEGA